MRRSGLGCSGGCGTGTAGEGGSSPPAGQWWAGGAGRALGCSPEEPRRSRVFNRSLGLANLFSSFGK